MPIDTPQLLDTARQIIEISATIAFALSGVLKAAHKKLDVVGVCVLAFIAAFGGGTLRDLLLDNRPFFWASHDYLVWAVLFMSLLAISFLRRKHFQITERAMLWPDMLGLGLFTAVGVDLAAELGMSPLISVMMGVVTGVFGGVLRDVLCGEIPQAFRDHQPYAVCAFAGGGADLLLRQFDAVHETAPLLACVVVTAGLRALAMWRQWRIPSWRMED
ncbi:trimeric intracellular cation channel family protein [Diaphorobacter ruginosibacter]|uniref:Trimeric intracellular cation channel family protein n=1 Tax=Diaphorobacter ruginosibacter TaxID=1715720 RepID=A0A7G9RVI4_9BURK|nr:trimeric intracellular cation channel family protein [Diaphorobacter ruginosibacter]QNN59609.1 trimeric intracellular cation channel family protein [Diaphorobacter ruginosibacter]